MIDSKEVISKEEAFKKGYLQNKKVFLKPVIRGGKMIKSSEHVAYFQYEGANNWFQLARTNRNTLVNPFKDDEEKRFFEAELDVDLSIHKKKDNFWATFFVKVVKDWNLMHIGYEFDLSDPMDVLRFKVMQHEPTCAPDWEHKFSKGEYRFALVEEDYEEKVETDATQKLISAYTFLGTLKSSATKMKEFLGTYLMETKSTKQVPADASKEWLSKEIKKVIESDISTMLNLIDDKDASIKHLILKGITVGAITKEGRNNYNIPGEGVSYMLDELVKYLKTAERTKTDMYLKLIAQVKIDK
jgi:hypothetical protein